jgi:hypothetical protein
VSGSGEALREFDPAITLDAIGLKRLTHRAVMLSKAETDANEARVSHRAGLEKVHDKPSSTTAKTNASAGRGRSRMGITCGRSADPARLGGSGCAKWRGMTSLRRPSKRKPVARRNRVCDSRELIGHRSRH